MLCTTTACNFSSLICTGGPAAALASHSTSRFRTFSRTCIFFLLTLSLLWSSFFFSSLLFSSPLFSSLLFSSLILPTSGFPSVHIVGSLTSKLPSILMNSDDFIKNDYDFAQIWAFARNLCFLPRNSPSFSRTPTKSAKGCCRKWLSNEPWSKFHVVRVAGGHT